MEFGFGGGLGLIRCGSWLGSIGFRLGLGRGVVSIRAGVEGVCVKMGWCFRWSSCWVVLGLIWGGALDWGIVKNHHTLFIYSTAAYFVPSDDVKRHMYPTYTIRVAYCVGKVHNVLHCSILCRIRVHNMLFDGARCVGSTLWLNNAPLVIDQS